jgi:SAM-dependent methyltransferase
MEQDFTDIKSYNNNMAKPMDDKLFFFDKFEWPERALLVDFGCADGRVLAAIKDRVESLVGYHDTKYVGYDKSEAMIDFAKTNWDGGGTNIQFTSNWNEVESMIKDHKAYVPVLLLSSVIHEVYSYCTKNDIAEFWERVTNTGFEYVIIRDMMISKSAEGVSKYNIYRNPLLTNYRLKYLKSFTKVWGAVNENKNALHWLLKYRWTVNWDRENNENYLPMYTDQLISGMLPKYDIEYFEHYKLPFIVEKIKEDWGITLQDNTHVKSIFKLRK